MTMILAVVRSATVETLRHKPAQPAEVATVACCDRGAYSEETTMWFFRTLFAFLVGDVNCIESYCCEHRGRCIICGRRMK